MKSQVSMVKCNSYEPDLVLERTKQAIDLIGGISHFIPPKARVLIKPNLLMAKPPESGITTHPELVRAVIKILKSVDAEILVGDSPSSFREVERVSDVYEKTGMKKICEEEGVELVYFNHCFIEKDIPITTWVKECSHIVNLPKFKTHGFTTLTGAIKNLFGLVPGLYKTELHKTGLAIERFSKSLVDIYSVARPVLTIVDAITAMEGDGPASSGKLRNLNLILASKDAVAVDSLLATIMGLEPKDIVSTRQAAERGLGKINLADIQVQGLEVKDLAVRKFKLPTVTITQRLPRPVVKLMFRLIKFKPVINPKKCIGCEICAESCPMKIIQIKPTPRIDYNKNCRLCLCCQEVCPQGAIRIKKSFLANIIGM